MSGGVKADASAPVIEVEDVVSRFGTQTVHDGVSFTVQPGTLVGLIGGSGTGKSVLLREIIGLQRPTAGRCAVAGGQHAVWANATELNQLEDQGSQE